MRRVSLVIGLVKLETNFYVIINPNWILLPRSEDCNYTKIYIDIDDCTSTIEIVCRELWGEGTPFKVLEKSISDFILDEDVGKFDEQIEVYKATCEKHNEKYEIDLKKEIEMTMISMGLPLCCSFENEYIEKDAFIVMTKNDFERIVMPRVREIFNDENVEVKDDDQVYERILEVTKTICNCYRKR